MESAAIVVGIDAYRQQPLTSAVNNAKAFRDILIDLHLVDERNILMLTSPLLDSAQAATRDNIVDALYSFYRDGDSVERFIFFYAGHGLLTYSDAAHTRTNTVLMPVDVTSLSSQGNRLINLDELLDKLRLVGPQEQLYIIDACRDLAWERHPDVGSLGWDARDPDTARAQAVLYAASPQGKALAVPGGLGIMTDHLVKAFRGEGVALDYADLRGEFVVTMESVRNYVREAIAEVVKDQPLSRQKYTLPELRPAGPEAQPIRIVDAAHVSDASLTIHIDPDEAASDTKVTLTLKSVMLKDNCLPPRKNHETITLPPHPYNLVAESARGDPDPRRRVIDLRKEREVRIVVRPTGTARSTIPTVPDHGPVASPFAARQTLPPGLRLGKVRGRALEPHVTIEVEGLEPPYLHRSNVGRLEEEVQVGPYRVSFRLGPDVFNQVEIYVEDGETVEVLPTVATSPLIQEMLGTDGDVPPSTVISESIGDIQAGVLPTMLPIIGIKPFDVHHKVFSRFEGLVPPLDPHDFAMHPLSVVVAIDGNHWGVTPREVLQSVACSIATPSSYGRETRTVLFSGLQPLSRGSPPPSDYWVPPAGEQAAWERIGRLTATAPDAPFIVGIISPYFGSIQMVGAVLPNRVTVITATLHPDGSVDLSQNLLRLPGMSQLYHPEVEPDMPYGRMLRELQLGQKLYASGELITTGEIIVRQGARDNPSSQISADLIAQLLYAKWTDPILGCMAYYAARQAIAAGTVEDCRFPLETTAGNLNRFFGQLPDSRVIYGLQHEGERDQVFSELIMTNQVPVLAESTRTLARYARKRGHAEPDVVTYAARIPVGQIWTMSLSPTFVSA